jgi:enamine deaminase RidA (YjgF/YER057c/UK114 family)
MSFLLLFVLLVIGFAGYQLWRIANALLVIAGCIGFDEMKKAGILEEMRAQAQQVLETAAKGRT